MAKNKKKRNKPYRGKDASLDRPVITRVQAVNRNPVNQWWFDHKRIAKPISIAVAVALLIVWMIIEIIHLAIS